MPPPPDDDEEPDGDGDDYDYIHDYNNSDDYGDDDAAQSPGNRLFTKPTTSDGPLESRKAFLAKRHATARNEPIGQNNRQHEQPTGSYGGSGGQREGQVDGQASTREEVRRRVSIWRAARDYQERAHYDRSLFGRNADLDRAVARHQRENMLYNQGKCRLLLSR